MNITLIIEIFIPNNYFRITFIRFYLAIKMQGPLSSTVMIYSLIILLGIFTLSIQQITNPPDCASPLGYDIRNLTKYYELTKFFFSV